MAEIWSHGSWILFPHTKGELVKFYFLWITVYMAIHMIWDAVTRHTPPFHFGSMGGKISTLFGASTLASSILLLTGLVDGITEKMIGDTVLPLLLAGMSGMLVGLSGLCPYDYKILVAPVVKQRADL